MRDRRTGFTLIELLLVLVILTALAAIVVPKLTGSSKQAKITTATTTISNFETALDAFEIDCGRYPTTEEGLGALRNAPAGLEDEWKRSYLKRISNDPWGNAYIYKCPGQHNTDFYDLSSSGPDKQDGTEDDITNWDN